MEIRVKNVVSRLGWTKLVERINGKRALKRQHHAILEEDRFYSCSESMTTENLLKNRYFIPCFNYNRVDLPTEDGESNFINASYVDGYNFKGRFIIAQTPLEETAYNFWRMVFLHQTRVIVMLTDPSENEDYQYWSPLKGSRVVYGQFAVETRDIRSYGNVTVMNLRVSDGDENILDLEQFTYTNWPRNGVPQEKTEFLNFVITVREAQAAAEFEAFMDQMEVLPKLIVLSSSGRDRAGAFCLLDISMSRYDEFKTISLTSGLRELRKQRYNCMSLPNQYIFCSKVMSRYVKKAVDKMWNNFQFVLN